MTISKEWRNNCYYVDGAGNSSTVEFEGWTHRYWYTDNWYMAYPQCHFAIPINEQDLPQVVKLYMFLES